MLHGSCTLIGFCLGTCCTDLCSHEMHCAQLYCDVVHNSYLAKWTCSLKTREKLSFNLKAIIKDRVIWDNTFILYTNTVILTNVDIYSAHIHECLKFMMQENMVKFWHMLTGHKNGKLHKYRTQPLFFFLWHCGPTWTMASSFMRFLDHTRWRITASRTPLDEWSAHRRDLYLTTHDTHNRQTSTPPVGFILTFSAGKRLQTYALDRVATGTGRTQPLIQLNNLQLLYRGWEGRVRKSAITEFSHQCI